VCAKLGNPCSFLILVPKSEDGNLTSFSAGFRVNCFRDSSGVLLGHEKAELKNVAVTPLAYLQRKVHCSVKITVETADAFRMSFAESIYALVVISCDE